MAEDVRAHITGVVFQVVAGVGQKVSAGDPILILESMKMEIPVEAPRAGVVRELRVAEGQTVQEGEVVATLDEPTGYELAEAGRPGRSVDRPGRR